MQTETTPQKKAWTAPKLVVYGSVEDLTRESKPKWFGTGDDLASTIS